MNEFRKSREFSLYRQLLFGLRAAEQRVPAACAQHGAVTPAGPAPGTIDSSAAEPVCFGRDAEQA